MTTAPFPTNRFAISSFVCGVMGWLIAILLFCFNMTLGALLTLATLGLAGLCFIPLGCIAPSVWIAGVITGHVGLGQIKRSGESGRGLAITGLVLSYIGLGILLCGIIALLASVGLSTISQYLSQPTR